jgi:hypothetical protein
MAGDDYLVLSWSEFKVDKQCCHYTSASIGDPLVLSVPKILPMLYYRPTCTRILPQVNSLC